MVATEVFPPPHVQVLVVGGGPAGSSAASALAREGLDVVVFESASFPRYHIGESLIPSVRHYLRFIGAEEKVEQWGFARKPGAAMKLNQHKLEGYTDFCALGPKGPVWNVPRAEFDQLLLRHAAESGARVYERTKVTELHFDTTQDLSDVDKSSPFAHAMGRPISARYTMATATGPREGTTTFDYLIDASGRAGLLSNKYFKSRKFTESLKNVAFWGYWRGASSYMANSGLNREGAAYFEALTDESGWAWFIPLHNGTTSVGIVMNQQVYNERVKSGPFVGTKLVDRYLAMLKFAPHVSEVIGSGIIVDVFGPDEKGDICAHPVIKIASDFSYSAATYAGNGWRIAGDAGAFIDPFFSSGIHLALTGGLAAATSICAAVRKDCEERLAAQWHDQRIGVSYTRFLVVVLGAYKQIRSQSSTALADIDEGNFDRAFSMIRPLIQGAGDMGAHLHESELQEAVDFCGKLIAPSNAKTITALQQRLDDGGLLDVNAPVQDPKKLNEVADKLSNNGRTDVEKTEALSLLEKVNARRVIHKEHNTISNFEGEPLVLVDGAQFGWVARLERGRLGLVQAEK